LVGMLRAQPPGAEIIVADGASTDETVARARLAGADRVLSTARGRGQQLHEAAAWARGTIVWFLHADTVPPPGAARALSDAMDRDPECVGGNFRLLFDGGDGFSAWLNGFYAWIRRRGFYYGDSGIFVRREVLNRIGGVRPIAQVEDYDLVRRLERAGRTTCIDHPPLITSARRFVGRPPVAIVAGWLRIHVAYMLGTRPDRLALSYDSERRRAR